MYIMFMSLFICWAFIGHFNKVYKELRKIKEALGIHEADIADDA